VGDGWLGWPEEAPFDGIVVSASAPCVPEALVAQLLEGGRMAIPVGETLMLVRRTAEGYEQQPVIGVRFVPCTGPNAEAHRTP
jgi:protein-L-isoaspartate(D-aspartate) O-methyltransferase